MAAPSMSSYAPTRPTVNSTWDRKRLMAVAREAIIRRALWLRTPTHTQVDVMPMIFLSYSAKDDLFAQILETKLSDAEVPLWRDQNKLRVGKPWRQEIEKGISESAALVVALSENS